MIYFYRRANWLSGKRLVRNRMWKEIYCRGIVLSIIFCPYVLIMISKEVFSCGVGGIVVSIAAFQAVDPGSIPGRRTILFLLHLQANIDHGSSDNSLFSHGCSVLFQIVLYFFLLKTVFFFLCEIKVDPLTIVSYKIKFSSLFVSCY